MNHRLTKYREEFSDLFAMQGYYAQLTTEELLEIQLVELVNNEAQALPQLQMIIFVQAELLKRAHSNGLI